MRKAILTFFVLIIFIIFTPVIKGEETTIPAQKPPGSGGVRQIIKKDVIDRMESIKNNKIENVLEKQTEIKEKREEFKMTIQKQREEAKEEFKIRREEFKTKMSEIKDQRKKEVVERVDNRLSTVNKNRTAALTKHLDQMSSILVRVQERATKRKSEGVNTSAVDKAIVEAESAIDTAKEAINTQASIEYIVTITDETKLKVDVKTVFDQFKSNMEATVLTVKKAKEALTAAARLLGGGTDG